MAEDWRDLFDGETLDGWQATGDPDAWLVDDGHVVCTGEGGGYLVTEETYEDFELTLEYRHEPDVNSGVFVRISDLDDVVHTGLELQILDTHGVDEPTVHTAGALYDMVAPSTEAARPPGEWNRMTVTVDGPHLAETLNGETVVEANIDEWDTPGRNPDGTENKFTKHAWADLPNEGHVGLQDHGGRIRFRDLRLRTL